MPVPRKTKSLISCLANLFVGSRALSSALQEVALGDWMNIICKSGKGISSANGGKEFPSNWIYPQECLHKLCERFSPPQWLNQRAKILRVFDTFATATGVKQQKQASGKDLILSLRNLGEDREFVVGNKCVSVFLRCSEAWAQHGRTQPGIYAAELQNMVPRPNSVAGDLDVAGGVVLRCTTSTYVDSYKARCPVSEATIYSLTII